MLTWFGQKSTHPLASSSGLSLDISHVLARAGIPGYRQALPLITSEFERARRYNHPLSLALFGMVTAIEAAGASSSRNGHGTPEAAGLFPAVLASLLRESTREIDIVTYVAMLARCLVLMPETDRPAAEYAVRRLRTLAGQRLLTPVTTGVAVFPADGLVLDELVRLAAAQPLRATV